MMIRSRDPLRVFFLLLFLCTMAAAPSLAAVGCDLNDPDNDVPRLFPDSTGYKTIYASIGKSGGNPLYKRIENRLGSKYISLYAPLDVPYTIYEINKGKNKVGYIHGVNQKGQFGGLQVFIAQDLQGTIKTFYIQKMTAKWAPKLRDPKFGKKFVGLSIKDFEAFDPVSGKGSGRLSDIRNPAPEGETDFYAVLRALKKNLILMDEFVFSPGGKR